MRISKNQLLWLIFLVFFFTSAFHAPVCVASLPLLSSPCPSGSHGAVLCSQLYLRLSLHLLLLDLPKNNITLFWSNSYNSLTWMKMGQKK